MNQPVSDNLFCPLPWIGYSIRNNGYVRICCHANQGPNNGILAKGDKSFTYNDSIEETRNSETLKSVRLSILNNEWHSECIRCQKEYISGITSRNINETERFQYHFGLEDAKRVTDTDGAIDTDLTPLIYFDLRFGNFCNLRCRMCFATDSSGWYRDVKKIFGLNSYKDTGESMKIIERDGKYLIENDPYVWYQHEGFWEDLAKYISDVKSIYIVGGEPLLIKRHYEFLEECISRGVASNIHMEYNTNMTTIPNKAWDLWKHFKDVRFGVSIDGTDKVNDYIRYPSKWKVIEKNLKKLDEAEGNFIVRISPTISVLNIWNLPDLVEWKLKQNFKRIFSPWGRPLSPHILHNPKYLNIQMFPPESKNRIREHLANSLDSINRVATPKIQRGVRKMFQEYINFMYYADFQKYIPEFWKINDIMDEDRNQKLDEYIPELRRLIK